MEHDLIFDLGMHDGADTEFYLRKGFRVVAVEADPVLASEARAKFARQIAERRLTVVNKAVAVTAGSVVLHRVANTLWSTIEQGRAALAARKGSDHHDVEVESITSTDLLQEFGVPYYLKIDIEGLDTAALKGLAESNDRPKYVSIEAERRDLQSVRAELEIFSSLGYDRFKVVAQHRVHLQREPNPPREGLAAGAPKAESSGLFGDDLPGTWITAPEALDAYRRPLFNHYLTGSDALIKNRWLRATLKRVGFRAGWYDTHGRLSPRWNAMQ